METKKYSRPQEILEDGYTVYGNAEDERYIKDGVVCQWDKEGSKMLVLEEKQVEENPVVKTKKELCVEILRDLKFEEYQPDLWRIPIDGGNAFVDFRTHKASGEPIKSASPMNGRRYASVDGVIVKDPDTIPVLREYHDRRLGLKVEDTEEDKERVRKAEAFLEKAGFGKEIEVKEDVVVGSKGGVLVAKQLKPEKKEEDVFERMDELDMEILEGNLEGLVYEYVDRDGKKKQSLTVDGISQAFLQQKGDHHVREYRVEEKGDKILGYVVYGFFIGGYVKEWLGVAEGNKNDKFAYRTVLAKATRNAIKRLITADIKNEIIKMAQAENKVIDLTKFKWT